MDTSAATPATPEKKPGFLINRNFALLWSGQSISNVGDFVFDTTLILWIATIIARGNPGRRWPSAASFWQPRSPSS